MPAEAEPIHTILDEGDTRELMTALAAEIDRAVDRSARLVLVGIRRRGDSIARRIAAELEGARGPLEPGSLDITLYRDDFAQVGALPQVGRTTIPEDIEGAHVVIVDDVLHTGRTIRAALNELADFGRARKVELCVLVDRGGRQLPIQPDYAGRRVEVEAGREISVRVPELDGAWGVDLVAVSSAPGGEGDANGGDAGVDARAPGGDGAP